MERFEAFVLRTVFAFPFGLHLSVKRSVLRTAVEFGVHLSVKRLVLRTTVVFGAHLSVKRLVLRTSGVFLYRDLCDFYEKPVKIYYRNMPSTGLRFRFFEIIVYFLFTRLISRNFAVKKRLC